MSDWQGWVGGRLQASASRLVIAALASILAIALVSLSAGSARAGDVSSQPWAGSSNDAALATLVAAPATAMAWQGAGASSTSIFSSAFGNIATALTERSALMLAGEATLEFPPLGAVAGGVLLVGGAAYLTYHVGSWWFHRKDTSGEWGSTAASGVMLRQLSQGTTWRYTNQYNMVRSFTIGSDGWVAVRNGNDTVGCAGPDPANGGAFYGATYGTYASNATVCQNLYSTLPASARLYLSGFYFNLPGRSLPAYVFFKSAAGASMPVDDVEPFANQPTNTVTRNWTQGHPTTAALATALRSALTGPLDTCAGSPCAWGATAPDQATATATQSLTNCALTPSCASSALDDTFTMPDCYGMLPSDCASSAGDLGFTGTLDDTPGDISDADYSQAAGVVVRTSPIAGAAVSTAAATIVDATTNPPACSWQVNFPHWSASGGTVVAKGTTICNYSTTVTSTMYLWKCDQLPTPDDLSVSALNGGAAGCSPAGGSIEERPVTANAENTFYVPRTDQSPVGGDGKYFVVYGALDNAAPGTSPAFAVNPAPIPETLP